jgi:hypothetical protein
MKEAVKYPTIILAIIFKNLTSSQTGEKPNFLLIDVKGGFCNMF